MIIGGGAIAKALLDRDDRLYFASGVSNSQETRESEYWREIKLIQQQDKTRRFVYFSSLCVFTSNSRYAQHKRQCEDIAKQVFPFYTIIRIGNAEWADNPCQLIPAIKEHCKTGNPFPIYNEYRFLLKKTEFRYWMEQIPNWNCEMNITGEMIHVRDLVKRYKDAGVNWDLAFKTRAD